MQATHRREFPGSRPPQAELEQLSLVSLEADVERAMTRGGDPEGDVLHACVEAIASYLQAPAVRLWTLDEAGQVLEPRARAGSCCLPLCDAPVPVGQRLIGQIAAARLPRFVDEWREDQPDEAELAPGSQTGVAAFAGYPLLAGDRLHGVLALWVRRPLSGATRAALGTIANTIALGLEARRTQAALRESEARYRRPARLALVTDVSERQRLEEHLRQTQKMEAIGLLAGGIAHDFNNLLTVIGGYASLVSREVPAASRMRSHVGEIIRAADRAASLTQQLLAFSRQQVMQPRVLDLNALLGEMGGLLQRIIREDIELVFALDPEAGHVLADPTQVEQVVMNLVVNARDAMPSGGKLTLTTADARLGGSEGGGAFNVVTGNYVRLTVSDTGVGMDAATRSRAFEPFFTTKEKGRGTGLGLSTVYGVVKQSGGYVWLESEPDRGCSVQVYLPRIDQPQEAKAHTAPPEVAAAQAAGGTVLVAEDEEAVRSLVVKVLADGGYRVLQAAGGREALELCRSHEGEIHLLLTDVVMPGMSGPDLVRQVAEHHPEARVLYMSGYPDKAIAGPALAHDLVLLEKPFIPANLVRRVREVLDAPRS